MTQVFDDCPVDGNLMLLMLVLADSADEETRMAWPGLKRLTARSRTSRATVYRLMSRLESFGLIREIHGSERPVAAQGGCTRCWYISTTDSWSAGIGSQSETVDTYQQSQSETVDKPVSPMRQEPTTNITTNRLEELRSSNERAPRDSSSSKPRSSFSKLQEAFEDEIDPAKALDLYEQPVTHRSPHRFGHSPDSPMGLAQHWVDTMSLVEWGSGLDISNRTALAAKFKLWLRGGTTAEEIRTMTVLYANDAGMRNPRKTPWVDYLAKRALLYDGVNRGKREQAMEANRDNPAYWTGV